MKVTKTVKRHWLLLVAGTALAVAALAAYAPGVSASSVPVTEQAAGVTSGSYTYCQWWQYWGGRWWGPVSRPYGASSCGVYRTSTSLYQGIWVTVK